MTPEVTVRFDGDDGSDRFAASDTDTAVWKTNSAGGYAAARFFTRHLRRVNRKAKGLMTLQFTVNSMRNAFSGTVLREWERRHKQTIEFVIGGAVLAIVLVILYQ